MGLFLTVIEGLLYRPDLRKRDPRQCRSGVVSAYQLDKCAFVHAIAGSFAQKGTLARVLECAFEHAADGGSGGLLRCGRGQRQEQVAVRDRRESAALDPGGDFRGPVGHEGRIYPV
jgi:hypothetical protein